MEKVLFKNDFRDFISRQAVPYISTEYLWEAYDCKTFYKEICYISREEMLLNESVEDYLRYAAHADLKADNIEQMRRKVKLRPEIKNIEENGATLSGGEKRNCLCSNGF